MKKLLLCIPVLLMQGCSGAASQPADIHMKEDRYEIEQGAQLDIYLPDEGHVRIYVEDTGRGIPREEQRMIFSRFYKQNEFSQGAGLGLSICQVIIEKLGGRIDLKSEVGKGSRFTVILPCRVVS